ncbi:MAG TPA: exopolysaccharide biosynthesis polyprenyl glycosylphosphotransferase [Novosphingobium sp.]|nr:exopolysaccharide biosynthesis polyprenyl glycosylphosphotransferase [Novosphingobium sp.]
MPSLERRRLQCYLGLLIADMAALFTGMALAGYLYEGAFGLDHGLLVAQLVLPIFLTVAIYNGSYSIATLERASRGAARSVLALAASVMIVLFIAFYARSNEQFSRVIVSLGFAVSGVMLVWLRLQMRAFVRWRCGADVINRLVIDDGGPGVDNLATYVVSAADFGLRPALDDPHALDRIGMVLRHADQVVVSCPPERRRAWAMVLKGANVEGEVIDASVADLGARGARTLDGHGLLSVSSGPLGLRSRVMKRMLDVSVAGLALVALSPLLALVALAIVIEDRGPVFFVQKRLGRGNRFFHMYKFRSMRVERSDADGTVSASRGDARITRVGRFIRCTSIDELPQLINVLLGDMSLVGPRPHAIGSQAGDKLFWEVDQRYWLRHALKPGITGLAQVRGWRGATDTEQDLEGRLDADLEYLRGWSLWRDVRILVATVRVLVHDRAF